MSDLYLPKHGLNISRSELPQIKSTDVSDFLHWLKSNKHATVTHTELPVTALYPSQGEFNQVKIKALMGKERSNLKKPIIVSGDHYVLDGHHRWLALLNLDKNETIPAIVVHMKILDLLAATKEYPKSFTKSIIESFQSIVEAKEHHTVLAFGRMNPPTTGHAKLVDKVHEVAKKYNASHAVVLSHSQDEKKNPLSQEDKIRHAKNFFPNTTIVGSSKEAPTLFHHAANAYKAGAEHLHVVMGSDRVKEFQDALKKHNGKFDEKGNGYQFKSITVHSAGQRDPDAEGTEGMSASKMREHASKGNFNEFKKGIPSHVSDKHAKALYNDVRKGMKVKDTLKESIEVLEEGVHDAGIFKAVFLAGGPGSGKDFVLKKALDGHGLTEINSDKALEVLMDRAKLSKKMPDAEKYQRDVVRDRAKSLTDLRHNLAVEGRNGLIINSTGANAEKIAKIKKHLDELGYDSKMVFVDTSDDVSRQRNIERGQRGGRQVPEQVRANKYKEAQDSRVAFSQMFGKDHYHEFDNNEDLRVNLDPETHKNKAKDLMGLFKTIRKFTQTSPEHPAAKAWIQTHLGKLAKMPVGNKQQQKSVLPPAEGSQAAEDAKRMGLQYFGFGRYGKGGKVTHLSVHDKLVEKQKTLPQLPEKKSVKNVETTYLGQKVPVLETVNAAFLELLAEGEPVRDTGEEGGPILGSDKVAGEIIDDTGKATAQRKFFGQFRKERQS